MATPRKKLRELRGKKPIQEVADALNISVSTLSKYERGEREPRDEKKKQIAEYYKRSIQYIFFSED